MTFKATIGVLPGREGNGVLVLEGDSGEFEVVADGALGVAVVKDGKRDTHVYPSGKWGHLHVVQAEE